MTISPFSITEPLQRDGSGWDYLRDIYRIKQDSLQDLLDNAYDASASLICVSIRFGETSPLSSYVQILSSNHAKEVLFSDTRLIIPNWEVPERSKDFIEELIKSLSDAAKEKQALFKNLCHRVIEKRQPSQQASAAEVNEKYIKPSVQNPLVKIIDFEVLQALFIIKRIHQVIKFCLQVIRYLLAIIRYLLYARVFDALIRAFHRKLFVRHSPRYKPQTTDDDYRNTFPHRFSGARTGMCCYVSIAS